MRSRRARTVGLLLLLFVLGSSAGCGYRLAGQGSSVLPEHVKALIVAPFENQTLVPGSSNS